MWYRPLDSADGGFDVPHVLRLPLQLCARLCLRSLLIFEQALDFDWDFYALAACRACFHGVKPPPEVRQAVNGNA